MTAVASLKVIVTGDTTDLKSAMTEARTEVAGLGTLAQASAGKLAAAGGTLDLVAANANRAGSSIAAGTARVAQGTGLAAHEVTNLTYQMSDMTMMLASGQSPFIVMMQQGSQVSQILGQRGLGSIIPALGAGLMSLVSPTTLFLAGITAAGYAGAWAFRQIVPEVEPLNDLLEQQDDLLKRLRQSYLDTGKAGAASSGESQAVLLAKLDAVRRQAEKSLQQEFDRLTAAVPDQTDMLGRPLDPNLNKTLLASLYSDPVDAALQKLKDAGSGVNDKFLAFQGTMATISQDKSLDQSIRDKALEFIKLTEDAATAERKIKDALQPGSFEAGRRAERDMGPYSAFLSAEEVKLKRMREAADAALAGLSARSPDEKATAARAAAAAQVNSGESAAERNLRIELAGTEALTRATRDLTEAQRQRSAALDETLAGARLDLSLVGQSAAETARLRMEHQLLSVLRRDAAQKGVEIDQAEIAAIRQKAAEYARLNALASARAAIHGKSIETAQMTLELALVGSGIAARKETLALYQAEVDIRQRGLDLYGAEAEAIRAQARDMANLNTELERQQDAWNSLKGAGESAIDGFVSKLGSGDFEGALKGLGEDLTKFTLQMAVANPLKNFVFGSEHGTMEDVVSGGLLGKLFGRGGGSASAAAAAAIQSVASMEVTAASVIVNGTALGGALGGGTGGSLLGALTGGKAAVAANDNSNAGQIWNFFQAKGLKDFQISAIMGNLQAESGLNPLAVNPNGGASGLAQHLGDRLAGLKAFGGGAIPGMDGQLDYIWKELQTSESGVLKKLLSATNLRSATGAFAGFERAEGWSPKNPEGIALWDKRFGAASSFMDRFGGGADIAGAAHIDKFNTALDSASQTANTATTALGSVSNSANDFAKTLATIGGGAGGGIPFGNLFPNASISPTLSAVLAGGGGGLFDSGGWTGDGHPSEVAGLAHHQEFYIKAGPAARFRPLLEAINGNRPVSEEAAGLAARLIGSSPAKPAASSNPVATPAQAAALAAGGRTSDGPRDVASGFAEKGDFVVRAGPARANRTLLEAINGNSPAGPDTAAPAVRLADANVARPGAPANPVLNVIQNARPAQAAALAAGGWTGDGPQDVASGFAEKGDFVVRAGPARADRTLLEAINGNSPADSAASAVRLADANAARPSRAAGVTHGQEFTVKADAARRFRPMLEAINQNRLPGYAQGGWVGGAPGASMTAMQSSGADPQGRSGGASVNIQIIDNAGVSKRQEQGTDGNGRDVIRLVLDQVGSEMGSGGYDGALGGRFGARPVKVAR